MPKEKSLRQQVFGKLDDNSDLELDDLYKFFIKAAHSTIRKYLSEWNKAHPKSVTLVTPQDDSSSSVISQGSGITPAIIPAGLPTPTSGKYKMINIKTVHDLLLRWANGEKINPNLVLHCINFCKGFKEHLKGEGLEINLEWFEEIGKTHASNSLVSRTPEG